jgi:cytochrome c-type biogenesis protein CcmH/NrfG
LSQSPNRPHVWHNAQDSLGERDATAYYNLGNAPMSVGQTAEAVDNYQRALQLKPDQPDYLRNLATAFQRLNQGERAAVLLERLRQLEQGPQ